MIKMVSEPSDRCIGWKVIEHSTTAQGQDANDQYVTCMLERGQADDTIDTIFMTTINIYAISPPLSLDSVLYLSANSFTKIQAQTKCVRARRN